MNLSDLNTAHETTLPAASTIWRIQRSRARSGSVAIGAIRLPPTGLMLGRFDLVTEPVGYFAETAETAIHETLTRRETTGLPFKGIAARAILCVQTKANLRLLDLRPHTTQWPVLQALRYAATQGLADTARKAGFDGLVYHSAQQYDRDCYALFGNALSKTKLVYRHPLVEPGTGNLHRALVTAVTGSMVPVLP